MRLTHVSLRYPPALGGVEDYVQSVVTRLRTAGDEVAVETTKLKTHVPATFLEKINDPSYVHRHDVWTFSLFAYPIPKGFTAQLKAQSSQLIHAHGFWYAPADIAARVARERRIPFVLNPYYAPRRKFVWQAYRALVGEATVNDADAVVVISPQEEAALRRDGFRPRRVVLIPPGIDPAEFAVRRENPFALFGLEARRVLLFAGRITRAKGLDLLFRALPTVLRQAPDVHVAIAGEDFGERAEFQATAAALGIERLVTWLGKLTRDQLVGAYQHAAAFVFPSRYEAFGIAPLEAQAAGCPVIAMDVASLPFVVQDGTTGLLFRPEDVADLTRKILRLLGDRALAQRFSAAGRERAHKEFPWERSIASLRALYADLVPHQTV